MRTFIAIDIDEQTRTALARLQDELKSKVDIKKSDAKWVRPDSIHLTLKFLGEIKDKQLVEVCSITEEVASRHKSFELNIEALGSFGGRAARVLWVGTGQGSENLKQLQKDLENKLAEAGWPMEKRDFAGHLTLCRIRNSAAGVKLAGAAEEYKNYKLGSISVESISVYQSQLTPKGPNYTVLGNYKLQ